MLTPQTSLSSVWERTVDLPSGESSVLVLGGITDNFYVLHGVVYQYTGSTGAYQFSLRFGADPTDRFVARLQSPTVGSPPTQRFYVPFPGLLLSAGEAITFLADAAVDGAALCTLLFELKPYGARWFWEDLIEPLRCSCALQIDDLELSFDGSGVLSFEVELSFDGSGVLSFETAGESLDGSGVLEFQDLEVSLGGSGYVDTG